jgi:hypothetical protein
VKFLYHVSKDGLAHNCADDYHASANDICSATDTYALFARKVSMKTVIKKEKDGGICKTNSTLHVDWSTQTRTRWGPYLESVGITAVQNRCDQQPHQQLQLQLPTQHIKQPGTELLQYVDNKSNRLKGRVGQTYKRKTRDGSKGIHH